MKGRKNQVKPLPSQYEGPNESPGFLLWRVSNAWQREQRIALERFGLTHTQFVVLAVATWFGREEPLTQARLSQLTGSDPMTTSQVVRVLQKAGYFMRENHPTDTRAKVIVVSEAGRALAAKALRAVETTDEEFFSSLPSISSLVKMFRQLLDMK